MKVKLPKCMPRRLADVKPNSDEQFQMATHMALHGDKNQQEYARAWFAIAGPRMKVFGTDEAE